MQACVPSDMVGVLVVTVPLDHPTFPDESVLRIALFTVDRPEMIFVAEP